MNVLTAAEVWAGEKRRENTNPQKLGGTNIRLSIFNLGFRNF